MRYVYAAAAAVAVIAATYGYSAEVTRQRGEQFGTELAAIQEDVGRMQDEFYSAGTMRDEGDITGAELDAVYEGHLAGLGAALARYDELDPPDQFRGAVALLKESTSAQLESDRGYIEWSRTGDPVARARSDALLQESLEYELLGLAEFAAAKAGASRDADAPFTPPPPGISERAARAAQSMRDACAADHPGGGAGLEECVAAADEWLAGHLP